MCPWRIAQTFEESNNGSEHPGTETSDNRCAFKSMVLAVWYAEIEGGGETL